MAIEVVQSKITSDWFRGKYLSLALGLNITTLRLATALNDNVSPRIAERASLGWAGWMGLAVCLLAWLAGALLAWLHGRYHERWTVLDGKDVKEIEKGSERERERGRGGERERERERERKLGTSTESLGSDAPLLVSDRVELDTHFLESTRLLDTRENAANAANTLVNNSTDTARHDDSTNLFRIIGTFPLSFWTLCLILIVLYGVIVPFAHISSDFLQSKYVPGESERAGTLMSVPEFVSAVMAPLFGYLMDRQTAASEGDIEVEVEVDGDEEVKSKAGDGVKVRDKLASAELSDSDSSSSSSSSSNSSSSSSSSGDSSSSSINSNANANASTASIDSHGFRRQ